MFGGTFSTPRQFEARNVGYIRDFSLVEEFCGLDYSLGFAFAQLNVYNAQ